MDNKMMTEQLDYIYLPIFLKDPEGYWRVYGFQKVMDCTPKTKQEWEALEE